MIPTMLGDIYDSFTTRGLASLITRRTGKPPPGIPPTWTISKRLFYYTRLLELDDANWRFPFMQLPTELRLMVYEELFAPSPGCPCPEILRASKAILIEAEDLFYEKVKVRYRIVTRSEKFDKENGSPAMRYIIESFLGGKKVEHFLGQNGATHMARLLATIPRFPLLKARHIRLDVDFQCEMDSSFTPPRKVWDGVNHILYALASLLGENEKLKDVLTHCPSDSLWRYRSFQPVPDIQGVLLPVVRFARPGVRVSFDGQGLTGSVEQRLRTLIAAGARAPATPVQLLSELIRKGRRVGLLIGRVEEEYPRLGVFALACERLSMLHGKDRGVRDTGRDKQICRAITNVQSFWEDVCDEFEQLVVAEEILPWLAL